MWKINEHLKDEPKDLNIYIPFHPVLRYPLKILGMAEEIISKQEFNIRDLSTHAVTLYPASAHVVREISDIKLKVGLLRTICSFITKTNSLVEWSQ